MLLFSAIVCLVACQLPLGHGQLLLRVVHGAPSVDTIDIRIGLSEAEADVLNISSLELLSISSPQKVSPYYIIPVFATHAFAFADPESTAPLCAVSLPRQGTFTLAAWQHRVQEVHCTLFRDIRPERLSPWSTYVRLMHLSSSSQRINVRSRNHTIFPAASPISVTRYVRCPPGRQEFIVTSALRLGATRARLIANLRAGRAYTLVYADVGHAMGAPALFVMADQPEWQRPHHPWHDFLLRLAVLATLVTAVLLVGWSVRLYIREEHARLTRRDIGHWPQPADQVRRAHGASHQQVGSRVTIKLDPEVVSPPEGEEAASPLLPDGQGLVVLLPLFF